MPLHPDIEAYLDLVEMGRANGSTRPMNQCEPARARLDFDAASKIMGGEDIATSIQTLSIPVRDGAQIEARIHKGESTASDDVLYPALIYFHGGGYVVGSLDSHQTLCAQLAGASHRRVISVAYRLAPEHIFPTAVNDAADAINWLAEQAQQLGLDKTRMVFGGDSVGATLATVMAAMSIKEPYSVAIKPTKQLLLYPVTDAFSFAYPSLAEYAEGYLLETESLHWFYRHYDPDGAYRKDWRMSPLLAGDLSGLAPVVLVLPEFDPLLDQGRAYMQRLQHYGVTVDLRYFPGMTHDFLRMPALVEEVAEIIEQLGALLADP